ncbi:PREDICTED: uncharacterized protein LOC104596799 [Nelumbo nucifera]|uniref:protein-disulfide reductase n=2 Tax=Nelumbo nucifera TaxID=4432 RepID=A0A1U7ZSB5_NELNU|nr:PREDICTED: uncharacterized protein LOC104596799 [Nelumbo nucifera]DAD39204.1 TPA_asm: hypothetical protein HUJ06_013527 [Nelumbo nucifera]
MASRYTYDDSAATVAAAPGISTVSSSDASINDQDRCRPTHQVTYSDDEDYQYAYSDNYDTASSHGEKYYEVAYPDDQDYMDAYSDDDDDDEHEHENFQELCSDDNDYDTADDEYDEEKPDDDYPKTKVSSCLHQPSLTGESEPYAPLTDSMEVLIRKLNSPLFRKISSMAADLGVEEGNITRCSYIETLVRLKKAVLGVRFELSDAQNRNLGEFEFCGKLGDVACNIDKILDDIACSVLRSNLTKLGPEQESRMVEILDITIDAYKMKMNASISELEDAVEKLKGKTENESRRRRIFEALPENLKRCVFYACLFPKNYIFEKDTLVQLWVTAGLIEAGIERMEDPGNKYLRESLYPYFFEESSLDHGYTVHDDVYDLLHLHPGHEFARVEHDRFDCITENTRFSSFLCGDFGPETLESLSKAKILQTLLLLHDQRRCMEQIPSETFSKLRFLRVLDLSGTHILKLPSSIKESKDLRYLDLSNTPINKLSKSVGDLQNLQVLKLRHCKKLVELPNTFRKLTSLRYLDFDVIHQLTSMPPGMRSLINLEKMSGFIVGRGNEFQIQELKKMKRLRGSICISKLENVRGRGGALKANLRGKRQLLNLEFRWSKLEDSSEEVLEGLEPNENLRVLKIISYGGVNFPIWLGDSKFSKLEKISLSNCRNCTRLPPLGQLPSLKSLSMSEMHAVKQIDHQFCGDEFMKAFPKLQTLEFDGMSCLEEWTVIKAGEMPLLSKLTVVDCPNLVTLSVLSCFKSLEHLEIIFCPKLQSLPEGGLPEIKTLVIIGCPVLAEWFTKQGKDRSKIAGTPDIWIDYKQVSTINTTEEPTDERTKAEDVAIGQTEGDFHNLTSLLCTEQRDFLVQNNGKQVRVQEFMGKFVGLYFAGWWHSAVHWFTQILVETYNDLYHKNDFEVIFVSSDKDNESFIQHFSKMPWFAVPFSDAMTRDRLHEVFKVNNIPSLVILDKKGRVSSYNGAWIVRVHGVQGYPFTPEWIEKLQEDEKVVRKEQSLLSIMTSISDHLISNERNKVPISELQQKVVGMYFTTTSEVECLDFTAKLVEVYKELKNKGESFEVIWISLGNSQESYENGFRNMPWLAFPFEDKSYKKLYPYLELTTLPTLVVLGPNGETLNSNAVDLVREYAALAYPFSQKNLIEPEEMGNLNPNQQSLESILVSGEKDFVIRNDDARIHVSELVGKSILFYFSAQWFPPCRVSLQKLIKAYHEIKHKDDEFEVIYISYDTDLASFKEFFSGMPWLALPYGDDREKLLSRKFKIEGIPTVVAIGQTGRTITKNAWDHLMVHGANAYPFTSEHLKEMEQ